MKIPWHLILPEKALQDKLNQKLITVIKPFNYIGMFVGIFIQFSMLVNCVVYRRWENPDLINADLTGFAVISFGVICSIITLIVPKQLTNVLLIGRFFLSIGLCYKNYVRFEGKDMCLEPVSLQINYFKSLSAIRELIINIYIIVCIMCIPFLDKFFTGFLSISLEFAVELIFVERYYDNASKWAIVVVLMWSVLMFAVVYFIRRTLT